MKKTLALYKLFFPRNMIHLVIVSFLLLLSTTLATGEIIMPCESYIDSSYETSLNFNYLCSNPVFHKFIINITFTFNMIILSLFLSISTSYFFLIFKKNFKHIAKEFIDVGFAKNILLLSSLPIKENVLLKSIISYNFILIVIPLLILQLSPIIRFIRIFDWVGINLNTFSITITLVFLIISIITFKLLNSPKLNILLNLFVYFLLIVPIVFLPFFFEKIANYILENFSAFTKLAYLFNNNNPVFLIGTILVFIIITLILRTKLKILE